MTDYEQQAIQKLNQSIVLGKWSNKGLVQLVELCFEYLNPISLQEYADNEKITYNGALKRNVHISLLNQKYVLDND